MALSKQLVLDRHDVFDLFQDSKVHVFVVLAIVSITGVPPHQVDGMDVHGQKEEDPGYFFDDPFRLRSYHVYQVQGILELWHQRLLRDQQHPNDVEALRDFG